MNLFDELELEEEIERLKIENQNIKVSRDNVFRYNGKMNQELGRLRKLHRAVEEMSIPTHLWPEITGLKRVFEICEEISLKEQREQKVKK